MVKFIYVKELVADIQEKFPHTKNWPLLGEEEVIQMNRLKPQTANEENRDLLKDFDFDFIDNCCYISTFKVYIETIFDELKLAACEYWGFKD